jgi:hypothetical protein
MKKGGKNKRKKNVYQNTFKWSKAKVKEQPVVKGKK